MALPLRQDDPVSLLFMTKVLLVTAVLLAITYVVLRGYARRRGQRYIAADRPELQCTSVLRLSAKTRVYLLRSSQSEVLITESVTGTCVTLLPATSVPQAIGLKGPRPQ